MSPAKVFLQPDDPVTKAAFLMLENKLELLPVSDGKKRFFGLVRMMEIFDELVSVVIKK
jgi:CBS domain-containing protein